MINNIVVVSFGTATTTIVLRPPLPPQVNDMFPPFMPNILTVIENPVRFIVLRIIPDQKSFCFKTRWFQQRNNNWNRRGLCSGLQYYHCYYVSNGPRRSQIGYVWWRQWSIIMEFMMMMPFTAHRTISPFACGSLFFSYFFSNRSFFPFASCFFFCHFIRR